MHGLIPFLAACVTGASFAPRKHCRIVMMLLFAMSLCTMSHSRAQQNIPAPAAYDIEDLGTLGGNSFARGVNDVTEVVGYSEESGPTPILWEPGHAFYWDSTLGMQDLHDLLARSSAYELRKASAINNHHSIVGFAGSNRLGVVRAFLLKRTGMHPLTHRFVNLDTLPNGGISYALGVNNANVAVGAAYLDATGVGNNRAALFTHGRVIDLNATLGLLDRLQWLRLEATGINDHGEIVGWGMMRAYGHSSRLHGRISRAQAPLCLRRWEAGMPAVLWGVDLRPEATYG